MRSLATEATSQAGLVEMALKSEQDQHVDYHFASIYLHSLCLEEVLNIYHSSQETTVVRHLLSIQSWSRRAVTDIVPLVKNWKVFSYDPFVEDLQRAFRHLSSGKRKDCRQFVTFLSSFLRLNTVKDADRRPESLLRGTSFPPSGADALAWADFWNQLPARNLRIKAAFKPELVSLDMLNFCYQ